MIGEKHKPNEDPRAMSEHIFVRRLLITLAAVAVFVVLGLLVWYAARLLLIFFAGVMLAVALRLPSAWLASNTRLSQRVSFYIVCLLIVLLGAGGMLFLGADVIQQTRDISDKLPGALVDLRQQLRTTGWGRWLLYGASEIQSFEVDDPQVLGAVTGFASSTVAATVWAFVILFLGIYMAINPGVYVRGAVHLVPKIHRERAKDILEEMGDVLGRWLLAKLASMAVIGVLTWIGLALMGVPAALTLAILAGLLAFIPNVGPILSAIPAVLIAFVESPTLALQVIGLYIGVQAVESYLITPNIEKHAIYLPPGTIIAFQVLLGVTLGFMGLLVAAPVTAVMIVLMKRLYVEDTLGDQMGGAPDEHAPDEHVPDEHAKEQQEESEEPPHAPPRAA